MRPEDIVVGGVYRTQAHQTQPTIDRIVTKIYTHHAKDESYSLDLVDYVTTKNKVRGTQGLAMFAKHARERLA